MKHHPIVVLALAALPFVSAVSQVSPPNPPLPPTPPVAPLPPLPPDPPMAPLPPMGWNSPLDRLQIDEIRRSAEDARVAGMEAAQQARLSIQDIHVSVPFEFDSHFNFDFNSNSFHTFGDVGPRPAWAQGDPADSLWRLARDAINRTDYSKAAAQFNDLVVKYPGSRYAPDASYWEAFARYRVGTMDQLHLALKALDASTSKVDYMSQKSDAPALRARILSALSLRGDKSADDELKKLYAQNPTMCDAEQIGVRAQVLNSMYRSDPDGTMDQIRKQLATRDACNAELRKMAVSLLGERPDEQKTMIIANVAKTDTVREVRQRAVDVLSRMPGDLAISTLQDLMRDPDEQIQSSAVRALMRSDNPKARAAMRTLIDRKDSPERQRISAIQSFSRDNTTAEDAAYLRTLYARDESERVKEAIIQALGQTGTEDNVNFLLAIAKNTNESSSLRASALSRISRMNLGIDDLIKLYDATDSRNMRRSLVNALGNRKEDAATNKLLEIVKLSTDPEVKLLAIDVLLRKKDPEVNKKLAVIIGG